MLSRATVWLGLAAALLCSAPTLAAEPITKPETRSLPDQTVRNRLLAQLREILLPLPRPAPHKPAEVALSDLWYWTVPTLGQEEGVCRTNLVVFEFAPVERRDRGAESPVKMVGLTADWRYRMLEPGEVCEKLSPQEADFAAADGERVFVDGYRSFKVLQETVRSGTPIELECNRLRKGEKDCRSPILEVKPDDIGGYARCDPHPAGPPGLCREFRFGDYEVRVYSSFDKPDVVTAARITEQFVMWHERRD